MSSRARATIRQADGRTVGPVCIQGSGGPMNARDRARFEDAIARATAGKTVGWCYEPYPGHVRAFVFTAAADIDVDPIDLRGASLLAWEGDIDPFEL